MAKKNIISNDYDSSSQIKDLTGMLLGKVRSLCKMLANVFCLFFPLKGVRPYSISYNKIPEFQISTNEQVKQ